MAEDEEAEAEESESAQTANGELTVFGASAQTCSTLAVRGLSQQLVDELKCLKPGLVTEIQASDTITLEPEVFPFLQTAAARALERGAAAYGKKITITSALRTIPQQYMLRRWDLQNRCGIRIAAAVGDSNHEPGAAVDIRLMTSAENKKLRTSLASSGFTWLGSHDPVHFDYTGPPSEGAGDIGKLSVIAFKRLWNRNNPRARLTVNETYNATVEAKVKLAPAKGFPIGADCSDTSS